MSAPSHLTIAQHSPLLPCPLPAQQCALALAILLLLATGTGNYAIAASTEYLTSEQPVADSVEDAPQPMTETFKKEEKEPPLFPAMTDRLRDKTPFV
ncbi:MAG: hypothetical protein JSW10_07630, partial [Pseudomonadota bacterium]